MHIEQLISDTLNKIEIAQILRRETLEKLSQALGELSDYQEAEAHAVELQKLTQQKIVELRTVLQQQDQREATYQAQLRSLQAMLQPVELPQNDAEEPNEPSEEAKEPEEVVDESVGESA